MAAVARAARRPRIRGRRRHWRRRRLQLVAAEALALAVGLEERRVLVHLRGRQHQVARARVVVGQARRPARVRRDREAGRRHAVGRARDVARDAADRRIVKVGRGGRCERREREAGGHDRGVGVAPVVLQRAPRLQPTALGVGGRCCCGCRVRRLVKTPPRLVVVALEAARPAAHVVPSKDAPEDAGHASGVAGDAAAARAVSWRVPFLKLGQPAFGVFIVGAIQPGIGKAV